MSQSSFGVPIASFSTDGYRTRLCTVTHDSRFARSVQRKVHLFAGEIVSEIAPEKLQKEVEPIPC